MLHQKSEHESNLSKSISLNNYPATLKSIEQKEKGQNLTINFNYEGRKLNAIVKSNKIIDTLKNFIGYQILVNAELTKNIVQEEYESFNYSKYLNWQHLSYTGQLHSVDLSKQNKESFNLLNSSASCNYKVQEIFLQHIKDSSLAYLLIAILIGDKSHVSENVKQQFIATGTAHILAVSGMHIGILYAILKFLFSMISLKNKKWNSFKSAIIILAVWAFAFISGLGASVLRASVMFSLLELGLQLKRSSDSINIICGTAFIMLFYNPCMCYDVGFQLSFFAVLSIILFYPLLRRILVSTNSKINYLLETVNVSLAVQFLVTPISIYYFNCFPTYFLLSNLIWVPLSFLLMLVGLGIIFFHYIFLLASDLFGLFSEYCLKLGLKVFELLENLPYYQLTDLFIFPIQALFLILCILNIHWWIKGHNSKFLFLSISTLICYQLSPIIIGKLLSSKNELVVYKRKTDPLLDFHIGTNIIRIARPDYNPLQLTYYQKLFPYHSLQIYYTNFHEQFILNNIGDDLGNNKIKLAVDSISEPAKDYKFLFIQNKKFKPEELCEYAIDSIILLPYANFRTKLYYSKIKDQIDSKIWILDYRTVNIDL
ncbi:MAG: ComEC/Rec2 family competence protein [Saprospiraceae bacterium]